MNKKCVFSFEIYIDVYHKSCVNVLKKTCWFFTSSQRESSLRLIFSRVDKETNSRTHTLII